jgi:pyruvate/2-oxoglutarate/acetoin dehydrogenase E1 component
MWEGTDVTIISFGKGIKAHIAAEELAKEFHVKLSI